MNEGAQAQMFAKGVNVAYTVPHYKIPKFYAAYLTLRTVYVEAIASSSGINKL